MKNLTDIKSRIKSVSETRKITGAMETISVAKMRKAMARFENNHAYFETLKNTISDIAAHSRYVSNKYLKHNNSGNAVYVVISSDKGLAGGFNHNVLNFALKQIQDSPLKCSVFSVGEVGHEFFAARNIIVDGEFTSAAYDPTFADAGEIAASCINIFNSRAADEIYIIYTKLNNSASMSPDMIKLLPVSSDLFPEDEPKDYIVELEYDPSPEDVLESLIPQYLGGIIYGAMIQSSASEHCSRREAMDKATQNADEILEELGIEYNRARQESVTNELSEIITAAMGVSK